MGNKHIKVINGRKYYYESIRIGKKVTSRYLGPVEPIRKKKAHEEETKNEGPIDWNIAREPEQEEESPEENYIG